MIQRNDEGASLSPDRNGRDERGKDDFGTDEHTTEAWDELRSLLLGPEQQKIEQLEGRLDTPEVHAQELARSLPEAVRMRINEDEQLANALAPTIDETLQLSVRENPQRVADALSPVMMPAIRKSIGDTIRAMVESLNAALERSLSVQGLRWRWESIRTGRPFAEVVLLRNLLYRVEEVYLIHRPSGSLLQHVATGERAVESPELVSGMLTAIQDFVRDSFGADSNETLDTFRVGDFTVWVEQGPLTAIAMVIRGSAPVELRERLRDAQTVIRAQWTPQLEQFDGDTQSFEPVRPVLGSCLVEAAVPNAKKKKKLSPAFVIAALVVIAGLVTWGAMAWRSSARWSDYLGRLRSEPGILVVDVQDDSSPYQIVGMLDPLAKDPAQLLAESGFSQDGVETHWEAYLSSHPDFVRARAVRVLNPPPSIRLGYEAGVLTLAGSASHEWIQRSKLLSSVLPFVKQADDSAIVNLDRQRLEQLRLVIEQIEWQCQADVPRIDPERLQKVGELVPWLEETLTTAEILEEEVTLVVVLTGQRANLAALMPLWVSQLEDEFTGLGLPESGWNLKGDPQPTAAAETDPLLLSFRLEFQPRD